MTIAAGFVCSDGLLFASDTLYSGEQNIYGQKFWTCTKGEITVVFGGAGAQSALVRTRDLIEQRLTADMDRFDVVNEIEWCLRYVEQQFAPSEYERTFALIGVRIRERYWLYENQGGRSVLTVLDHNSHCVGAGHSLGLYFARSLFRTNMPLRWAKRVAAHLVNSVKEYDSGYCGGETYLLELPATGEPIPTTNQAHIAQLAGRLLQLEDALRLVLPGEDPAISDHSLEQRFGTLIDVINRLSRAQFIALPGPAHLISSGAVFPPTVTQSPPGTPDGPTVPPDQQSPTDDPSDQPPSPE